MTQQQVLAQIQAMKRQPMNLMDINKFKDQLADALSYLVQNTPEAKK